MKHYVCLGLLSLLLNACTSLNDKFDCPAPQGGSCKRMDEVYAMVNGEKRLAVVAVRNPLIIRNGANHKEGVMRLWIAPYEDTDGNYHQANQVYSVIRERPGIYLPPAVDK